MAMAKFITPAWIEQDEQLREMWAGGTSLDDIAITLDRTVTAVLTRAVRLGLPRRAAPGRKKYGEGRPANSNIIKKPRVSQRKQGAASENSKIRLCLMCGDGFNSAGPHNRICNSCKSSSEYASAGRLVDADFME